MSGCLPFGGVNSRFSPSLSLILRASSSMMESLESVCVWDRPEGSVYQEALSFISQVSVQVPQVDVHIS